MKTRLLQALLDWHLATDKPLPAWLARACQNHPVLLSHYNQGRQLSHRLSSSAQSLPSAQPSPHLAAKIHRALATETTAHCEPSSSFAWLKLALPLTAAAALTILITLRQTPSTDSTHADSAAALALLKQTPALLAQAEPIKSLRASGTSFEPLRQEAQHLRSDARAALSFLARNFLPEKSADSLPELPAEDDSAQHPTFIITHGLI